jgi:CheY-like chemotaxis protein
MLACSPLAVTIAEAVDVPDALSVLRRWQPDVVTLDMQLPGGSGLNVLYAIKQAGLSTTVIVLTTLDEPRIQQACFEAGAAYVLEKSSDMERLPAILMTIIRGIQNS